ncbi:MAG: hypothetical protein ACI97A_000429 [Planctomycetota bacterium]|jgi:hypothetical protein
MAIVPTWLAITLNSQLVINNRRQRAGERHTWLSHRPILSPISQNPSPQISRGNTWGRTFDECLRKAPPHD